MKDRTENRLPNTLKPELGDPCFLETIDELLECIETEPAELPDGDEILMQHNPVHDNIIDLNDLFLELQAANSQARTCSRRRDGKPHLVMLSIHHPPRSA